MKYILPALPILLAFAVVQPSDAQQRFYGSCAPVYHAPVYHQQVYSPPAEQVVVREVIVPVFTPLAVLVDPRLSYHYMGVNSLSFATPGFSQQFGGQLGGFGAQQQPFGALTQQQPFGSLAQPAAQAPSNGQSSTSDETVDALIDRIEKRVRQRQKGVAFEPPGPPVVPNFAPQREFAPKVSMLQVLGTHCAECHTKGEKPKGSFVIFDSPGQLAAGFDQRKAYAAVKDGRMPPREKPRLSEAAMQALK